MSSILKWGEAARQRTVVGRSTEAASDTIAGDLAAMSARGAWRGLFLWWVLGGLWFGGWMPEVWGRDAIASRANLCSDDGRNEFEGPWVSPQVVFRPTIVVAREDPKQARGPETAPAQFQPTDRSEAPPLAGGFGREIRPGRVERYTNAPVVRFLAPREAIANLFAELDLDDFNRYQFRRNRPDGIPVEHPERLQL